VRFVNRWVYCELGVPARLRSTSTRGWEVRTREGWTHCGATWLYKLDVLILSLIKVRGLDKETIERSRGLRSGGN